MDKGVDTSFLDLCLSGIKSGITKVLGLSINPANQGQITASNTLFEITLANSDTSVNASGTGRKLDFIAKSNVSVLQSGTLTHIVAVGTDVTKLPLKTSIANTALVQNGVVNLGAWNYAIAQPS